MNLKTISIFSLILVSFIAIGCISPQTEVPKTETTPTVTPIQVTQTIIPMEYAHSTLTKDKVDEVVESIKGNSFVRETEIHDTEVTIIYDVEKKDIDIAVKNSIRMLALFPDLQQINIIEYASGQKVVETSLTREDANNIIGHDVSEYGENLILWRIEVIDEIIYDREKLEQIFNQISIISTS